jgi:hypothetical protein
VQNYICRNCPAISRNVSLSRKIFHPCKRFFFFQWQTAANTPDVSNTNKRMQEQSNWVPVTIEWEEQSIWLHMHILHRGTARKLRDILTCRQVANTWEINADVPQMCFMRTRGIYPLYCGRCPVIRAPACTYSIRRIICVLFVLGFLVSYKKFPAGCRLYCSYLRNHYTVIRNTTQNTYSFFEIWGSHSGDG